jgi:ribosomal protein S18 acetylase RimI-like enzyme
VIIRAAQVGDVPALEDIVERAYSVYVERIARRPGPMDDDYGLLVRSAEADVFVAESIDRALRGLIVLEVASDHVLIANVAVDPDFQGKGIGRALLAYAEEFAAGRGLDEVRRLRT